MTVTDDRATAVAESDLTAGWTRWHSLREAELRAEHGWLSITAFHWLTEAPTTLPGLPGRWHSLGGWAQLTASGRDGLAAADGRRPAPRCTVRSSRASTRPAPPTGCGTEIG